MKFKLKPFLNVRSSGASTPERAEMRSRIERLIRLLREAMDGGVYEDFSAALRKIVRHRDEIQESFVASVRLVCALAHATEERYPKGHGRLKKEQVGAAIRYLFKADEFKLPNVPTYLRPYVIDLAVDWGIEFVVVISNEHGLWDTGRKPVPTSARAALGEALCWLKNVTQPIWGRIVEFFASIWEALQERTVFTPELQRALNNAVRVGLVKQKREWVGQVPRLAVWVADHREQVTAVFLLISEAVQEAEAFFSKSGSEKKAYARELIMATLEELGSPLGSGLFSFIIEAMIDNLIDAAVQLFNNFPESNPAFKHG